MDPTTKYYCRNVPSSAVSSLSVQSPSTHGCHGTNIANNATIPSEYMACESNHSQTSATGFNCKDLYARSMNNGSGTGANTNKTPIHQRNGMLSVTVGTQQLATNVGTSTSTTGYCSNNNNNNTSGTGNYINVMPVSMGTLQYNRRKLTPQEYQSRLFYNSADYRCREDYYAAAAATAAPAGNARVGTASPSSSLQMHVQHHQPHQQHHAQPQQHHTQQLQAQSQQHHHHHLTQLNQQQVPQHYHNNMSQQQQQQQQQQHIHHSHHHHHQTTCPTTVLDRVDEALSCSLQIVPNSTRLMVATQTQHQPSAGNCEQLMAPTALPLDAISAVPPLMYTVHRVMTTAQIQTAAGNTFTSASSVSSVVSAVRNEADNIGNILTPISGTPGGSGGVVGCDLNQCVNGASITADPSSGSRDTSTNINGNITVANICTSPGTSTNVSYLSNQTKQTVTPDSVRLTNLQYGGTPSLTNINYANNTTKTSTSSSTASSVSRPLQDVIPTCVYLMSRVAVHMEIEGTAQCPSQVMLAAALGCEELGIANKLLAQSIFGLWMASALLEIQLKSHHRPFLVRLAWSNLLEKFSHGNPIEKKFDEPMIMLKRNVFFSKRDEEKIKDHRILELLYEEAKHNVLTGRYIMEPVHSLMLGGIQARIELGPFNSHTHTVSFFRENQSRFLPQHVAKNSNWSWLPISRKNSAEIRLLEQFKRVPQTATTRKLMRKYLEFCWALPFYGAAFFHGQVEQPVRGLMSIVNHKDVEILIAVNERGVFIIDPAECTLLLGLRYEDLSWDFAKPSAVDDSECLTCIFLQFDAMENGIQISKLMQIFSRQAAMIDALISHFVEHMRKRKQEVNTTEQFHDEPNPIQNNGNGVLCNKLSRLTLATFDEEGRCIGQMGSLSISY